MNPGRVNIITRSSRLSDFTNSPTLIGKRAFQLFQDLNIVPSDVRGVGIQIEDLNNQTKSKKISTSPKNGKFFLNILINTFFYLSFLYRCWTTKTNKFLQEKINVKKIILFHCLQKLSLEILLIFYSKQNLHKLYFPKHVNLNYPIFYLILDL